jgi:Tol biopolymer transport system component
LNPTFTPDGKFLLFTSDRGTKGGKSQFRIWMGRLN